MRNFPNIQKSGWRPGEYVGFGKGCVWRIRKNKGYARSRFAWIAQTSPATEGVPCAFYAGTLSRLSEKLER